MTARHDGFSDVLGAYALDAVEPDEAREIEQHLRSCAVCAQEVAEHREVASLLVHGGSSAPEGIWDRIAAELSPPPPAMRLTFAPIAEPGAEQDADAVHASAGAGALADGGAPPDPVSLREHRRARSVPVKVFASALAVAACLLVAVGVVVVDQARRIDRMETALIDARPAAPGGGAVDVRLTGTDGDLTAQAVVDRDGVGHLYAADLPAVPPGEVYQLWGKVDDTLLSLGAFGSGSDVVTFQVDPERLDGVQAFAVTRERSPGVVTSAQDAIVAGTVA